MIEDLLTAMIYTMITIVHISLCSIVVERSIKSSIAEIPTCNVDCSNTKTGLSESETKKLAKAILTTEFPSTDSVFQDSSIKLDVYKTERKTKFKSTD